MFLMALTIVKEFAFPLYVNAESKNYYTDIPQVVIETNEAINAGAYSEATIQILDSNSTSLNFEDSIKIKIRGNTTAGLDKKPYNIKLSSANSLLGMSSGKKYCLIANRLDKSLLRNKLVYDFSSKLNLEYSVESRFVDVWVNGTYQGNYLLTTPIEVGANRLNISSNNDYLLELESTRNKWGVTYVSSPVLGVRFAVNSPEKPSEKDITEISTTLSNAEWAMQQGNFSDICKYIDIPSFVDFYILEELFQPVDVAFSSTRFYIKNGKLFASPAWDYDLSSGNTNADLYDGYKAVNRGEAVYCRIVFWWFYLLQNDENFNRIVCARYKELYPIINNIYEDNSLGQNKIDRLINEYGASFHRDSEVAGWGFVQICLDRVPDATYEGNVEFLRDWLKRQSKFLYNHFDCDNLLNYDDYLESVYAANKYLMKNDSYTGELETLLNMDISQASQEEIDNITADINRIVENESGCITEDGIILTQYDYTNGTPSENLTEGNQEGGYLPTAGILSGQSRLFASVDGVNKRKLEWSKDVYAPLEGSVPVMTAGEKNPWSGNEKNYPYFEIKASTKGYQSLIFHADLGATKKGPKDWGLYYSLDGVTYHPVVASGSAVTYSLTNNKTLQTAFDGIPLPAELENQECIYLRMQATSFDTLSETSYCSGIGGEAAINNISLSGVAMEQQEENEYVAGTPYKLEDDVLTYDVSVPHVVIHAFYGNNTSSVVSPSAVSHNFIELYNPTDNDVSLKGWSLQYRSSGAGDNSSGWSQFAFDDSAVIGAHSSYLVRGNELQYTEENAVQITRADAEWNISFSNQGGSVVLSYNNASLPIDSGVFDNAAKLPMVAGYVDMLGVSGNKDGIEQSAPATEKEASAAQSEKQGVRRKDTFVNGYMVPVDSDDNRVEGYREVSEAGDWLMIDYSVDNEAYRNWALPRSSEDGVWNTEAVCPIYTVTWNLNYDGAENVFATHKYGYAFSKITDPERKGYVFEEWYLDSDGSLAYNFEEKPSSDVKLYAKWKKIEYSIRYHLNGGVNAATNPEQYTVEDEVVFTQPEKEGYTFEGWYSEEAFEHKVDGITKGTIGDVALYAKWKQTEVLPTAEPTVDPTLQPTVEPTFQPAVQPTADPVIQPTEQPATGETTLIDISAAVVSKIPKRKYTGRKMKPVVVVTYAGCTLKKGKDYTISYKNNRKVGKAKVIIKGKGIYTGKKQITFLIVESYKQYKVKSDVVLRRKTSKTTPAIRNIQTGHSIKLVKGYHKKSKGGNWYKVKVGKNYYYVLLKKPVKM